MDQLITFGAQCKTADCSCVPIQGGKRVFASGSSINIPVDIIGNNAVVTPLSAPEWASIAIADSILTISGNAPSGVHTLVYDVENDCSHECLIVEISASGACSPPANIVKNLKISETNASVTLDVALQYPSTIVTSNLPFETSVYGTNLVINGSFSEPFPSSYELTLASECGNYTISGSVGVCRKPRLASNVGSASFERGEFSQFDWIIDGDFLSLDDKSLLPNGLDWVVLPNSPVGKTTIRVNGSPAENTGAGKMTATVKGLCGSLKLDKAFTQAPCRATQFVSQSGSSQMEIDQPVNYCKIVKGFQPEIASYENLPLGLSVDIAPHTVSGQWIVCITGTPVLDACKASKDGRICDCAKITLKNECGSYELDFCFNLNVTAINRPAYCVGVYSINETTNLLEVWGVTPNTSVSIAGVGVSPSSLAIDGSGYGSATISIAAPPAGQADSCAYIEHPTCALIFKGAIVVKCVAAPIPPDPV